MLVPEPLSGLVPSKNTAPMSICMSGFLLFTPLISTAGKFCRLEYGMALVALSVSGSEASSLNIKLNNLTWPALVEPIYGGILLPKSVRSFTSSSFEPKNISLLVIQVLSG